MGVRVKWAYLAFLLFGLSACVRNAPNSSYLAPQLSSSQSTSTPFQPIQWTAVPATPTISPTPAPPTATHTPTSSPFSIWLAPYLANRLGNQIALPEAWGFTSDPGAAALQIKVGEENRISQWIYVLVAPFPTVMDGVSAQSLLLTWKGESDVFLGGVPLLMAESTLEAISAYWGEPAPGVVRISQASELVDRAWEQRPSWAIIPFEELPGLCPFAH